MSRMDTLASFSGFDPTEFGLETAGWSRFPEMKVKCPFHHDNVASATFNVQRGLFHCFGCQLGMKSNTLGMWLGVEVPYRESINIAKSKSDVEIDLHRLMMCDLALDNDYLVSRGVTNDLVELLQIRTNGTHIIIPHFDFVGAIRGAQLRSISAGSRYLTVGDVSRPWPAHLIHQFDVPNRAVFVTEGPFGTMRAMRSGVQAVACSGAGNVLRISRQLGSIPFIGLFDDDYAGMIAAAQMIVTVGHKVLLSGAEADELTGDEWRELDEIALTVNPRFTGRVAQLIDRVTFPQRDGYITFVKSLCERNGYK